MNRTLHVNLDFTTSQIMRGTLIVVGVLLGIYFLQQLLPVVLLLLVAMMLATAIEPLVNRLRRGPFSRTTGILVVYTGIFLTIVILAWLTIPVIASQVSDVVAQMPKISANIRDVGVQTHSSFLQVQLNTVADVLDRTFGRAPTPPANPEEAVQQTTTTVLSLVESVFSILAIFVIAFYWLT